MRNAISVDVEDWFQVGAFETTISRADWHGLECRVERNIHEILQLFSDHHVVATFFTLGWMAERYPNLMREIAAAGHEIASHGYDHQRVFTMTPDQFIADLRKSRALIEDASQARVTGYRAPSFSIDARTPWAHEILADLGYDYSSSVAPIKHDHYGWPEAPRFAFHPVEGSNFVEIPVTTAVLGSKRLAAGGGGFFRLLPYQFSKWAIDQVNEKDGRPAILYFHPWEIDPDQPRVDNAPLKSKLRHYSRLDAMKGKLARLCGAYEWDLMRNIAAEQRDNMIKNIAA
ncbi:polysaccharide deacetylase [Sphingorhabdus lutea]|uniref:Chitooligosaccharide deacetylase n=1 Tax=Sphingorhabdus lutea TaxID=1913578 RepID=A0A1L3JBE3_9SPHN|nr:XrtA system polysaccharide deacetylase [Sphingorhabdus lutea]APG62455.1 polysaccharide deacetylase [Sphingorhabdus lutea]